MPPETGGESGGGSEKMKEKSLKRYDTSKDRESKWLGSK